ncbi:MAG TPA: GDP-mannose 4,6-dehydratase [Caulobacteraceae bacterium]|jgi:GDPmannose 4,6-dehydratase
MARRALITGVTGQDGAYLSQLLLGHGYEVFGLAGRAFTPGVSDERLRWLGVAGDVAIVAADLLDSGGLVGLIEQVRPDEVYNLAAQSSVAMSWRQPRAMGQITSMGAANLLEALKLARPGARFYQASSSEIFGRIEAESQDEATPTYPRSPYAAAKLLGHWMTVCYRESFGVHASAGILFNHESPLRPATFVTRKVTETAARIKRGLASELRLGNIDARRDWGHARDHVRAMWLMLQQDVPDDYVIATGRSTSVRAMCEIAFDYLDLKLDDHLVVDPALWRPAEVAVLHGDPGKAQRVLGWTAETSLEALIHEMVDADLARLDG